MNDQKLRCWLKLHAWVKDKYSYRPQRFCKCCGKKQYRVFLTNEWKDI